MCVCVVGVLLSVSQRKSTLPPWTHRKKRCSVPRPSAHQSGIQCSCVDNFRKLSRSPNRPPPPRPASPKVVPDSPRRENSPRPPWTHRKRGCARPRRRCATVLGRARASLDAPGPITLTSPDRTRRELAPGDLGPPKGRCAPSQSPLHRGAGARACAPIELTIFENCQDPRTGRPPAPRLA